MQSFESTRLLMRPLCVDDQAFYCACYTDPVLMQHIGEPLTQQAALRSFSAAMKLNSATPARRRSWVIQEKESSAATGLLALIYDYSRQDRVNAELGHIMHARFQNRGFTIEAIDKLADIVFSTTNLSTIIVNHRSKNGAVARAAKKLGFLQEINDNPGALCCRWALSRNHWSALRTGQIQSDYNCRHVPIR